MTTTLAPFHSGGQQPWGCDLTKLLPACVTTASKTVMHSSQISLCQSSFYTRLWDRMPEDWVTNTLATPPLRSGGQQPWGCDLTRPLGGVLLNVLSQSSGSHAREWMTTTLVTPPWSLATSSHGAVTSPEPKGVCNSIIKECAKTNSHPAIS